ncbi:MAG: hypothetical protein U5R06_05540 [candidate division KSB1 bacterium]|nr:hypothetical protein [candidate division KSB1 bacterium]
MNQKFMQVTIIGMMMLVMTLPAQTADFGVRVGSYTDMEELFVGGELLTPLARHTYLNPNIEYILLEDATYMTFNLDAHYDFFHSRRAFMWAGAGLAIQYFDWDGKDNSNTETGLNLLMGLGFDTVGDVTPYIQGKLILGDYDDFVIGLGLRF